MIKKLTCILLMLIMLLPLLPLAAIETDAQSNVTLDDIVKAASTVVRENEGNYSSVNANDNGALSIGWIQWHANRALNLLKTIVSANPENAKSILGDSLYNEINTSTNWNTRVLNTDEAKRVSSLLSTTEGKTAQDELAAQDLSSYINRAIGYGIKDPSALVYYADIENQCGSGGAKRVAQAAEALAGSYANITLEHIYQAALADSIAGRYVIRRQKTYNNCLLLDWTIIGTDLEVWNIKSARNVRRSADTTSEIVTSIAAGTKVIISEKAYVNSQTRGKTSMGWITLEAPACELNTELSGGTVPAPLVFDTAGGTFGDSPVAEKTLSGINKSRPANSLILYDKGYGQKAPQTNAYGAEVAVGADGIVISSPAYGTCKTTIPDGGFVLSGIGTGYTWLAQNVKVGNYIYYDPERAAIYVYSSYSSYAAVIKATGQATHKNVSRPANSLVLYDNDYGQKAPQTNAYGAEAAIDSTGKVISAPYYGTCKTTIPNGGFVLSGIGTGYTWLSQNIKLGDYVYIDPQTLSITVYNSRDKYLSQHKTTETGLAYGTLPTPVKAGTDFLGWYISGTSTPVTASTLCSSPYTVILKASWDSFLGHEITFNTNGGSLVDKGAATTVNGVNVARPSNSIVVYDKKYGYSAPQTNEFGAEVAVNKNGEVISAPFYGTCKTEIPEGGFVISAIGAGFDWLSKNVAKGNYVYFDKTSSTLTVYKTKAVYDAIHKKTLPGKAIGALPEAAREYHKFLGWYTADGVKASEGTSMPTVGLTLYAKWEVLPGTLSFDAGSGQVDGLISSQTLHGINVSRKANSLVLYNNKASTGTNVYGCEAVIDANNVVCAVYPYGYGNSQIPAGCSVLSGIGTMYTWIQKNLQIGYYVVIENNTVYVWTNEHAYNASKTTTVKYGEKYGTLPTAQREGYVFKGWQDKNGKTVVEGDVVSLYGDVVLTAIWEKLCTVTFDANGGTVVSSGAIAKATGINVHRGTNALIIYSGKASTGTNVYGTEAVIRYDGTVVAVYPHGKGNAQIPEGCFVLSGNGTMSTWLSTNVKVGGYVTVKGFTVTAYESRSAFDNADGKMFVEKGTKLPAFAYAILANKTLNGWYLNGTAVSKNTVINGDITLSAGWTTVSAVLNFDTAGGNFLPAISTTVTNGTNVPRPANSLIIYDQNYTYTKAQTNAYGTEVAVDKNGIVISSPAYGACKTEIPEGGFVLSGIGTGYTWLRQNVTVGCYIHRDTDTSAVTVYRSYDDYLYSLGKVITLNSQYGALPTPVREGYVFAGWKDASGNIVTDTTTVTSCEDPRLTAIWKAVYEISFDTSGGDVSTSTTVATGTNVSRGGNALVVYRDKATTGTNIYGSEAVVDKTGKIIAVYPYGKGNAAIPEGGFVLSGHGTKSEWIKANLSVGYYVYVAGNTVVVYKTELIYNISRGNTVTVYEGDKITGLPTPVRHGYTFIGWYCGDTKLSEGASVSLSGVYAAKWSPVEMTVTLDASDGSFGAALTATANGKNAVRGANQLIIYDRSSGKTSTGTNVYGTEIVVESNGTVSAVRPFGNGNAEIPEGGFVLSGHDTASTWLRSNIAVGDTVIVSDLEISVYKKGSSPEAYSVKAYYGSAIGALPVPEKAGCTFQGWYTADNVLITGNTLITFSVEDFTLYAKWEG